MAKQTINNGESGLNVRTKINENTTELYDKDAAQDVTIAGKSDLGHNHDGVYEPVDSTILRDADIGATVQAKTDNLVVDATYVHTDNNYTSTEKNKLAGVEDNANNYVHPASHTLADISDSGTAAGKDTGTLAGNVVELEVGAKLPAVDGSQLINLPNDNVLTIDQEAAIDNANAPNGTNPFATQSDIAGFGTGNGDGDMLAATYDPTGVIGDAFSMDNMEETTTAKILTSTERSHIAANDAKVGITSQQATDIELNNTHRGTVTDNPHSVTATNIGLGSVDNTADADKPISDATATALSGKAATVHTHTLNDVTDSGSAASLDVGTTANNIVQLDGNAKLPAVDGSQLIGLPASGAQNLPDLGDVSIGVKVTDQGLVWNGSQWINAGVNAEKFGGQLPSYYAVAGSGGGGTSVTAVAGETISTNDLLSLDASGKVLKTAINPSTPSYNENASAYNGTYYVNTNLCYCPSDDCWIFFTGSTSNNAYNLGKVEGGTFVSKDANAGISANYGPLAICAHPTESYALAIFEDKTTYHIQMAVITITSSGTVISEATRSEMIADSGTDYRMYFDESAGCFVVTYVVQSGSDLSACAVSVSGTVATSGTPAVTTVNPASEHDSCYNTTDGLGIMVYSDRGTLLYARTISVSGLVVTLGTEQTLLSGAAYYKIAVAHDVASNTYILFHSTNAYTDLYAQPFTLSASTVSAGTPITIDSGTNLNRVAATNDGTDVLAVWCWHTYTPNIVSTSSNGATVSVNTKIEDVGGEYIYVHDLAIGNGQAIAIGYAPNSSSHYPWYHMFDLAAGTNNVADFFGSAAEDGVLDDVIAVNTIGSTITTSGLTPKSLYYLDANINFTTNSTENVLVGVAISDTELLVTKVQEPDAPSGSSITMVAGGTITTGDAIAATANDTVESVTKTAVVFQDVTEGLLGSETSYSYADVAYSAESDVFLGIYGSQSDTRYMQIPVVSGVPVPAASIDAVFNNYSHMSLASQNKTDTFLCMYVDPDVSNHLHGIAITIDGADIWSWTKVQVIAGAGYNPQTYYDETSGSFLTLFRNSLDNYDLYCVASTITGTTVVHGAPVAVGLNTNTFSATYCSALGKIVIAYDNGAATIIKVVNISVTTVTFGNFESFMYQHDDISLQYLSHNNTWALGYLDGSSYGIWPFTFDGTTITLGTKYTHSGAGSPSNTQVIYDAKTGLVAQPFSTNTDAHIPWFELDGASVLDANYWTAFTYANGLSGRAANGNGVVMCVGTRADDSYKPGFVSANFSGGDSNVANTFGIATTDAVLDGSVSVISVGNVATMTGLTPNAKYYVSDTGVISTDASGVLLGRAISSTQLLITL